MQRASCFIAVAATLCASGCGPELPPVVAGEGGRWELLAPLGEGARQETAVVSLRGEVVVLGGFNGLGAQSTLVEAYDPDGDAWRRLADLPTSMHHANAAVVGDEIVVAGFLVGVDFIPDGRVFVYDADDDAWRTGAPMPSGTARGAAGTTAKDGAVYVFGGIAGGSSVLASRYDVATDTWQELADLPGALDHLGAVTVGSDVIVVGGRTNGVGNHTGDVLRLDEATSAYVPGSPMPTTRAGFGLAVVGDELVVAGGEGNAAGGTNGVFRQAEAYDVATDAWRALVDMRTPRHGMGAASVGNALYVPGGAQSQGFGATDVHERFVLDDDT